jgi:hypothetical protein
LNLAAKSKKRRAWVVPFSRPYTPSRQTGNEAVLRKREHGNRLGHVCAVPAAMKFARYDNNLYIVESQNSDMRHSVPAFIKI